MSILKHSNMKKLVFLWLLTAVVLLPAQVSTDEATWVGQSCTSIMVGKKASVDGSVITSHTCDGRYRTWMYMEPAADHPAGAKHAVCTGTAHTAFRGDTTGVRVVGEIPEVMHTFAYLNTAYPCMNEKQLAMGETTFTGPDTLINPKGMFLIEELQRIALQRCDNARSAIRLIGQLVKQYGYRDGGECITIADKNEVWQMEILGEGPDRIGGVWAAQRIPDDEVGVSANIPRIGRLQRENPDYFMCSDNCERVARRYRLWDGNGEFIFWKAFNSSYAQGKNFREREYFILNALAPSLHLTMDMPELPFSVRPDVGVDVQQVMALFRATYEGTDMDMCQNLKVPVQRKDAQGVVTTDTTLSPSANPWMTGATQRLYNSLAPGAVTFRRTVSVAWCSYSHVIQLRDWLPDAVGGVCWLSVDNPGQSPRIPVFCGTTRLPHAFDLCGHKGYNPDAVLWQYRKANKLATLGWQTLKQGMLQKVLQHETQAIQRLKKLDKSVASLYEHATTEVELQRAATSAAALLNDFTFQVYDETSAEWGRLEKSYWERFGMGF